MQFKAFKNSVFDKMDIMDGWHERMVTAELALALKNPLLEAEY